MEIHHITQARYDGFYSKKALLILRQDFVKCVAAQTHA